MITEDYVSFETAKLLKEKGFDVECYDFYEQEICGVYDYDVTTPQQKHSQKYKPINWNNEDDDSSIVCSVPSQSLALKWLREVHKIHISINVGCDVDNKNYIFYIPTIVKLNNKSVEYIDPFCEDEDEFDSNEEAVEAALLYVLKKLI